MNENVWERQELLFKIKLLKDRVEAFESGEKYVQMEKLHKIARAGDFRTIQHLKKELAQEGQRKCMSGSSGMRHVWIYRMSAITN